MRPDELERSNAYETAPLPFGQLHLTRGRLGVYDRLPTRGGLEFQVPADIYVVAARIVNWPGERFSAFRGLSSLWVGPANRPVARGEVIGNVSIDSGACAIADASMGPSLGDAAPESLLDERMSAG